MPLARDLQTRPTSWSRSSTNSLRDHLLTTSVPPPSHLTMTADNEPLTPEHMLAFYRRLYPFKSIFTWLNHDHVPTKLFFQREFAFTLQGDVYLRYQSFNNAEELKKQVCALNPTRFEIGPMYSARVGRPRTNRRASLAERAVTYCSQRTRRQFDRLHLHHFFASSCSISI